MTFKETLKQETQLVNQVIEAYLPRITGNAGLLLEAMNYSVTAGGKRLRPLLIRTTYHMFGGTENLAEPFMAAMEMIHTHSLVHDDLPAMDNDLYRRGKKTTWAVYGEAMAVLAGDALLNLAYETASRAFALSPGNVNVEKAFRILTAKTGINGMMGGQSVDVQMDKQPLDRELLSYIYALKTGALLEGSLMIGAQLAGAGDAQIQVLEQVGALIGMAFQIRDDVLDVEGDQALLGKAVGSDERNEKTTYVTIYGLDASKARAEELTRQGLKKLEDLSDGVKDPCAASFLYELLSSLAGRNS